MESALQWFNDFKWRITFIFYGLWITKKCFTFNNSLRFQNVLFIVLKVIYLCYIFMVIEKQVSFSLISQLTSIFSAVLMRKVKKQE